jgi:rubrerythrin
VTAAGGTVAFVAACGGSSRSSSTTATTNGQTGLAADVGILNNAIDLEHTAIAAYTAGIPLLSGTSQKAARQFLLQEISHVFTLSTLIKRGGGKPRPAKPSYNLGHPRREADVLALLHMVERTLISAYLDAIPKVSPGDIRARLASILANEAQHTAILRQALGQPVTDALVSGAE